MRLDEIWAKRSDLRLVAWRPETDIYVSMAHKSVEAATKKHKPDDREATDWVLAEMLEPGKFTPVKRGK